MNAKFPEFRLLGKGICLPPQCKELSLARKPGESVFWSLANGEVRHGILKKWNNQTAIVATEIQIPMK